jgi:hypothetical protein
VSVPSNEPSGGWWSRRKTWQKVAIIAGGVFVLLIVLAGIFGETDDATDEASDTSTTAATDEPTSSASVTTSSEPAETTTTTTATTTTVPPTEGGTMDDPVPAGEWFPVGEWQIAVAGTDTEATEAVLTENQFNEPPAEGNRFVVWRVAVTNLGSEPTQPAIGLSFSSVGPSAVAYDYEATCGVVPDELSSFRTLYPGGTIEGNLCWEVTDSDAESLLMLVDESFSFSGGRAVFAPAAAGEVLEVEYPEPPPPDPNGPAGSRGDPIPLQETVAIGDWEVRVLGSIDDATDQVLVENQFNEPPSEGNQFVVVEIEATYVGTDSSMFTLDTTIGAVGNAAVGYGSEDTCGVIPNELDDFSEVFPGGVISGNVCWEVPTSDVGGLVMSLEEAFSFDEVVWFLAIR